MYEPHYFVKIGPFASKAVAESIALAVKETLGRTFEGSAIQQLPEPAVVLLEEDRKAASSGPTG